MQTKISEKIIELRKSANLTQQQLAAAVNVTAAAVSKWETGVSVPDVETLYALADFFEVSMDTLLCYTPKVTRAAVFLYDYKGEQICQTLSQKGVVVVGVARSLLEVQDLLATAKNVHLLVAISVAEPPEFVTARLNELTSKHNLQLLTVNASDENQIEYLLDVALKGFFVK